MRLRTFGLVAVSAAALAGGAQAHAVFTNADAEAGAHWAGAVRIGHACQPGQATTAVRIEIPAGIDLARAQPKAGWTLTIEREPLAQPINDHGKVLTERVKAVIWTGRLPEDQFDEFAIAAKLPDQAGSLVFPVVQTCEGSESRWTEVPAADGSRPKYPAPVLNLSASVKHRSH